MEEMNEFEEIEDRVKESGAKPKRKLGKKGKIILAVVLPIVLVVGGGGFYYAAFHPMRENVQEKPIVKLPTKYVGNVYIFPFNRAYTLSNDTPLEKYWQREFYKGRVWTISKDNITLTITPRGGEFEGAKEYQLGQFYVTLNSSTYIEKAIFISNATYIYELGNFPAVNIDYNIDYPSEYNKYIVKKVYGFYNSYELIAFKFQKSNVSMRFLNVVDIPQRVTNATLPYYFTAYIETKDKIYEMNFVFNLTDEWGPYLDLWDLYIKYNSLYIPNATYFCYNPSWGKVVISNHLVPGTKYYFVEKNGVLSGIWNPQHLINGGR